MSTNQFCPAGSTQMASVTNTSSNVYVTSTQPVNSYLVVNSGAAPVQLRFGGNLAAPINAVFPTVGSPTLGPIAAASSTGVFTVPSNLFSTIGSPAGFNSNIQISLISNSATAGNVFITPVVI